MTVREIDYTDMPDAPITDFHHEVEVTLGEVEATVTLYLECTEFSTSPSGQYGPPEFYDPGGPAEFDLEYAEVTIGEEKPETLRLSKNFFWALLGDKAQLAYDEAVEKAQESGDF